MRVNEKIKKAKEKARKGQLTDETGYSSIRKQGKRPTKTHVSDDYQRLTKQDLYKMMDEEDDYDW